MRPNNKFQRNILPAVAAAILNNKEEILLQRRRDVNQWCVISGHVEFGETIEEAVLREVMEETNAKGKILRLIGIYSSPDSQTYHYANKSIQYITSYFQVQLESELDLSFSNNETKELRFFSKDNIPRELALINENWLNDVLDKNSNVFVR
jgi:ADP-ribose pyrophosphatase YjhB (NUDIX family)